MGGILFTITFGLFGPLDFALSWYVRSTASRMVLLFPLLVIITYLTMSVGLALNTSGTGHTDELTHRPFAWAYFVVCTWVGSAAWSAITKSSEPETRRRMSFGIVPLLLLVPWLFGKEIEVGPSRLWKNTEAWWKMPVGLVESARFLRDHSRATDVVQRLAGRSSGLCVVGARGATTVRTSIDLLCNRKAQLPKIVADRYAQIIETQEAHGEVRHHRVRSPKSNQVVCGPSGGHSRVGQIPSSLHPHSSRRDTASMNLDNEGCAVLS